MMERNGKTPTFRCTISPELAELSSRRDPLFDTVIDEACNAFRKMGIDPTLYNLRLKSIDLSEDGEYYNVTVTLTQKGEGV